MRSGHLELLAQLTIEEQGDIPNLTSFVRRIVVMFFVLHMLWVLTWAVSQPLDAFWTPLVAL